MRLDKYLCDLNIGTRTEVKKLIAAKKITVNGAVVTQSNMQIKEQEDVVALGGEVLSYSKFRYYWLHKPAGVITATEDSYHKTVMDFFPEKERRDLFPVGRLDIDTEGLLLITNDGELGHRLLSPKRHVEKTYYIKARDVITDSQCQQLTEGVDIGERSITLPAICKPLSDKELLLTITEGKFHQVKRMLSAVSNEVVYLKRVSFAGISLEEGLSKGEYRPLTEEEIRYLYEFK